MLKIRIPRREQFNEDTNQFFYYPDRDIDLQLEHSLLSVSKWESKWHKPFLSSKDDFTQAELTDYIRCMTLNTVNDPKVYNYLTPENIKAISDYIGDPMTATTFRNDGNKKSREIITSEIIYYWMVSFQIPFECQKWHLNRLITLIRVCSEKNAPQKKMKTTDVISRNRALNRARRQQLHSRG